MDIAAMSMSLAQFKVQQQVSVSVAKKAMDAAEIQMEGIVEMIDDIAPAPQVSASATSGQIIDVKV